MVHVHRIIIIVYVGSRAMNSSNAVLCFEGQGVVLPAPYLHKV